MLFDEQKFLNTTYNKSFSTKIPAVPEGSDWKGISKKIGFKKINFKDKETGEPKEAQMLTLTWEIEDPRLEPIVGRKTAQVRQEFWLDLKKDGTLDDGPGKNRQLGLMQEAFGQGNGAPWNPQMLIGLAGMLTITHRIGSDDSEIYATVKEVKAI